MRLGSLKALREQLAQPQTHRLYLSVQHFSRTLEGKHESTGGTPAVSHQEHTEREEE